MREYNHAHDSRLHIWSYRRRDETSLAPPIIVRFTIRDVFTVYVTLDTAADGSLVTESAAAFGPREKVGTFRHNICIQCFRASFGSDTASLPLETTTFAVRLPGISKPIPTTDEDDPFTTTSTVPAGGGTSRTLN